MRRVPFSPLQVEPEEYEPRLLHIAKIGKQIRVTQVRLGSRTRVCFVCLAPFPGITPISLLCFHPFRSR